MFEHYENKIETLWTILSIHYVQSKCKPNKSYCLGRLIKSLCHILNNCLTTKISFAG